jgi:SAM-dependent methyltransferase
MNAKQETIETYNQTAAQMAEKFRGLGARISDIDRVFSILDKSNPSVLEIGCGDGRDAKEIVTRTDRYLGIDISSSMIELAKAHVPEALFQVADVETFEFPAGLDIIFAFASLLHSDKTAINAILRRAHQSLNGNGIFFISLKRDEYQSKIKQDEFGTRTFYFYTPEDIGEMIQNEYKIIFKEEQSFQNQDWFTLILQKH